MLITFGIGNIPTIVFIKLRPWIMNTTKLTLPDFKIKSCFEFKYYDFYIVIILFLFFLRNQKCIINKKNGQKYEFARAAILIPISAELLTIPQRKIN
jgi:hypothetical protein